MQLHEAMRKQHRNVADRAALTHQAGAREIVHGP
jgi:hypothetical protein